MSSASPSSSSPSSSESVKSKRHLKRKQEPSNSDDSGSDDDESSESSTALNLDLDKDHSETQDDEKEEREEGQEGLSHAAKRRQKKRQKLEEAGSKSLQRKVKTPKNGSKAAGDDKPKRQNSVWVGNLSFKTSSNDLRAFFEGAGEITRIHMPMKLTPGGEAKGKGKWPTAAAKQNRGFAYVDFATTESKAVAITFSEKNLAGRRLLIKNGEDFEGRPEVSTAVSDGANADTGRSKIAQKILSSQKQPPGPTIFLGNLGFETTVESISEMICAHHKTIKAKSKEIESTRSKADDEESAENGKPSTVKDIKTEVGIRKVRMGTFEDSGHCKGFAFVDFISVEHATAVLINPRNHKLDGRQLAVEYASPDAVRRGGHREKGAGRPDGQIKSASSKSGPVKREQGFVRGDATNASKAEGEETRQTRPRSDGSRDTSVRRRPRPGAALALAKRESAAIVPSEGVRMTF